MRKILLAYLCLIPFVSFAQIKGDAVIEWTDKKEMSYGDFKVIIPQFTGNNFHYDASQKTLLYTLKIRWQSRKNMFGKKTIITQPTILF